LPTPPSAGWSGSRLPRVISDAAICPTSASARFVIEVAAQSLRTWTPTIPVANRRDVGGPDGRVQVGDRARRARWHHRKENAPTRWRPRPASQLTSAEAVADQRAINLGRFRARCRPDSIRAECTPSSELDSEGETRAVRAPAPDVKAVLDQPLGARDVCSFEFAIGLVEQGDGPLCDRLRSSRKLLLDFMELDVTLVTSPDGRANRILFGTGQDLRARARFRRRRNRRSRSSTRTPCKPAGRRRLVDRFLQPRSDGMQPGRERRLVGRHRRSSRVSHDRPHAAIRSAATFGSRREPSPVRSSDVEQRPGRDHDRSERDEEGGDRQRAAGCGSRRRPRRAT